MMSIKSLIRYGFFVILILVLAITFLNNISLYKIKENNTSKNKIFEIIGIQENMNELTLDAILVNDSKLLDRIKEDFVNEEKKFEEIKSNFFEKDKNDLLDTFFIDIHNKEVVKKDLVTLFDNEHIIESSFDEVIKLQNEKIDLDENFKDLYPLENSLRKTLQSYIWNTNDISTIKNFADLQYYSKEALYQHKDEQRLDKWISKALYLKNHTKRKEYEKYLEIAYKLKNYILKINAIQKQENILTDSIQNILKQNRTLNSNIELSSENILDSFINGLTSMMGTISIFIVIFILFIFYKVDKDVGLSVNEIQKRVDDGLSEIKNLNTEIEQTQKEVVFTMGSIGESRSKETGNHVKRVAAYSKLLAKYYGLSKKEAEMLKQASPMHDIGKVAIPDAILNKPGRFDEKEREVMNTHSKLGYEMLKHSDRPLLKCAATVALEHHEKWDGTGYPKGLKGEDIHIFGRITALADVFDALGSDRCYKKAWDDERIFTLFKEERGKHFDPKLVDIFFEHLDEFLKIRDKFKDV
jgi:HD-GYP domain-containing protein (c-di-GMP phosphodiesterase class II)